VLISRSCPNSSHGVCPKIVPSIDISAVRLLPAATHPEGFVPTLGVGLPVPTHVPSLPFLPTSTVYSALHLAGLLHPAADHGVRHVSVVNTFKTPEHAGSRHDGLPSSRNPNAAWGQATATSLQVAAIARSARRIPLPHALPRTPRFCKTNLTLRFRGVSNESDPCSREAGTQSRCLHLSRWRFHPPKLSPRQ
jgi:hypothetical protein